MIIMMPPHKVRGAAKRLRRLLRERGIKVGRVASLDIAARLCGFDRWEHYLVRDIRQPLSPFDHDLAEWALAERRAFQLAVIGAAGLERFAREILEQVNPTASWKRETATRRNVRLATTPTEANSCFSHAKEW